MSDISPCSATLPASPVSDGVSPRSSSSDMFGAQLQDALQTGQTAASTSGTQTAALSPGKPADAATSAVKPARTPSSSLINHSQAQSASSARPVTAKTTSMQPADRSSAEVEPASAQTDAAGNDPATGTHAKEDARAQTGKTTIPAGTDPIPIFAATVPAKTAATDAGTGTGKARKTDAEPRHGDDDGATKADPSQNAPATITTPIQASQPVPVERGASVPGGTDLGSAGKSLNAGSRPVHAITAHATQAIPGTTDPAAAQPASTVDQTSASALPDQQQQTPFSLPAMLVPAAAMSAQNVAPSPGPASSASPGDGLAGTSDAGTASSLAGQVSGPMVALMQRPDGASSMAVSLHPKELGEVKIRLDRDAGGAVRVVVAATEPGTLRGLIADQSLLHAALDAAAVPTADRQISFELTGGQTGSDGTPSQGAQTGTGDRDQGGGNQARRQDWGSGNTGADETPTSTALPIAARTGLYRAGVNITA